MSLPTRPHLSVAAALATAVLLAPTAMAEGSKVQQSDRATRVDSGRSASSSVSRRSTPPAPPSSSSSGVGSASSPSYGRPTTAPGRPGSKIPTREEVRRRGDGGHGHGHGHGGHGYSGHGGYRYRYGYPYRWGYDPFYYPYSYPYSTWLYWGWGPTYYGYYGSPYGSRRPAYPSSYERSGPGALDLDVYPESTEVYVDGERLGVVDDFDGFPTYLWLDAGTYDVVLYAPGYQTIARQVSINAGDVIEVGDRLSPGESIRPEDLVSPSHERRDDRLRRDAERQRDAELWEPARPVDPGPQGPRTTPGDEQDIGRLRLAIEPPDAAIYLDGHFVGTGGELSNLSAGLIVEPGDHQVEAVRPGYSSRTVEVEVEEGSTVDLELDLTRPAP